MFINNFLKDAMKNNEIINEHQNGINNGNFE